LLKVVERELQERISLRLDNLIKVFWLRKRALANAKPKPFLQVPEGQGSGGFGIYGPTTICTTTSLSITK
jgi:hypothetical protein